MAFDWFNPDGGGAAGITPDVEAIAEWGPIQARMQSLYDSLHDAEAFARSVGGQNRLPAPALDALRAFRGAVTRAATSWSAYRDAVRLAAGRAINAGRLTPDQISLLRDGGLAGIPIVLGLAVVLGGFVTVGAVYAIKRRTQSDIADADAVRAAWLAQRAALGPTSPITPIPTPGGGGGGRGWSGAAESVGIAAVVVGAFLLAGKGR